jgi:Domain of unknown function (DUF4845)
MRAGQQGVSLLGLIIVAVIVIFALLLVMKITPSYIEYFAVKKAVVGIAAETRGRGASVSDIRRRFENRSAVDDINSVKAGDLEITKSGNDYVISASYRREVPLFGHVGLYFDFSVSSQD